MKTHQMVTALALAVLAWPVMAQSPNVLKGKQITESALIEALTPPPPGTRSFAPDVHGQPAPKPASQAISITFETNSTELTAQAKHELDVVGRALNSDRLSQFHFRLEGHADIRGNSAANQVLSEGRAGAVRQYLVQNHNIPEGRLKAVGKGDREPLNRANPAAAENRRVNFVTVTD